VGDDGGGGTGEMKAVYRFHSVLGPGGWIAPGWVEIGEDGAIAAVYDSAPDTPLIELVAGHAVPGMVNLHSHAFQRAMAGLAERAGPDGTSGDNF